MFFGIFWYFQVFRVFTRNRCSSNIGKAYVYFRYFYSQIWAEMKRKFSIHRVFSIQFGLKALIFRICTKDFFRVTHKVMGLICGGIALTINGVFLPQAQSSISLRLRFACNGFFNFFVVAIVVFLSCRIFEWPKCINMVWVNFYRKLTFWINGAVLPQFGPKVLRLWFSFSASAFYFRNLTNSLQL